MNVIKFEKPPKKKWDLWKCLFLHKWEKWEDYVIPKCYPDGTVREIQGQQRYCERCDKRQISEVRPY